MGQDGLDEDLSEVHIPGTSFRSSDTAHHSRILPSSQPALLPNTGFGDRQTLLMQAKAKLEPMDLVVMAYLEYKQRYSPGTESEQEMAISEDLVKGTRITSRPCGTAMRTAMRKSTRSEPWGSRGRPSTSIANREWARCVVVRSSVALPTARVRSFAQPVGQQGTRDEELPREVDSAGPEGVLC